MSGTTTRGPGWRTVAALGLLVAVVLVGGFVDGWAAPARAAAVAALLLIAAGATLLVLAPRPPVAAHGEQVEHSSTAGARLAASTGNAEQPSGANA